jgi:APA family basic amino acid/polyamine antiporter
MVRQSPNPQLRRELGLLEVTLSGVGIILGAGVYVLIGQAAGLTGNAI